MLCALETSGEIQTPTGHRPGQTEVADPAWAVRMDEMISRGPFQPKWFCDP